MVKSKTKIGLISLWSLVFVLVIISLLESLLIYLGVGFGDGNNPADLLLGEEGNARFLNNSIPCVHTIISPEQNCYELVFFGRSMVGGACGWSQDGDHKIALHCFDCNPTLWPDPPDNIPSCTIEQIDNIESIQLTAIENITTEIITFG